MNWKFIDAYKAYLRRSGLAKLGTAVALTGCALLIRLAAEPYLKGQLPYLTFFAAVLAASFLAGPGPAILSIVLGWVIGTWFFIEPGNTLLPHSDNDWFKSVGFLGFSTAAVAVMTLMSRRQRMLEHEIEQRALTEMALRISEEKLRMAKEAARMGAWDWDLVTGDLMWTDRCKALFALPADAAVSHDVFMSAIHPDDRECVRRAEEDAVHREDYDTEMRVPWPDGSVRWVASHGRAFFDETGRAVRMTGMTLDITDRKRAEEALRDSDTRKTEFLGVLSHELRNPLAPIRMGMHILDRVPADSPEATRAKEVVRRQTEHLSRLLDDLLDVTRVSRGKIRLQRENLDLCILVRRSFEDYRSMFERSEIEARLELPTDPVWVDADPTRIAQVVGNLLQNADKFTSTGGVVTVTVCAHRQDVDIVVRDTGLGMGPGVVEHMFEPFAQEERGLARTRGGLGLGLALAKGLIELHGGSIEAHSDGPGRGSAFTVTLPRVQTPPRVEATPVPTRLPQLKRKILIIEDNLDAAQTLATALDLEGHEVRIARDGTTGVAMAREMSPDVVLCDIGLPDFDGYAVARALRAEKTLRSTRLIALTGYAQPEDKERAKEAGFDAHLAKPTPIDEVTMALVSG